MTAIRTQSGHRALDMEDPDLPAWQSVGLDVNKLIDMVAIQYVRIRGDDRSGGWSSNRLSGRHHDVRGRCQRGASASTLQNGRRQTGSRRIDRL